MTKCWNAKAKPWASENSFWIKLLIFFPLSCGSDVSYFTCLSHALCFVQKLWPNWLEKSFKVPLCMKMIKSCFLCLNCQCYIMAETYFILRQSDLLSQRWVLLSSSLKSYLPDQEVRDYHQSQEQLQEYAEWLIPVLTNHLELLIGVWFVGKIFLCVCDTQMFKTG